jgi:hypothetical protein
MAAEMLVLNKGLLTEGKHSDEGEKLQRVPAGLKNVAHWVWRKGKAPSDKKGILIGWTDPSNWKTFGEVTEYSLQRNILSLGSIMFCRR